MNSLQTPDPNQGLDEQFNRHMQGLNALQNSSIQDLKTKLDNNLYDASAFEALGKFSDTFANLGQQVLKEKYEDEQAEGIRQARIDGVPEADQLALKNATDAASELDGELNKAADRAEEQDGHSVVANRIRSMSPQMGYGYEREQNKAKARGIQSMWDEAVRGSLTIINDNGEEITFSQINTPAEFERFEAKFEKNVYRNFAGQSAAVINEDVFPEMNKVLTYASVTWSQELGVKIKKEQKRLAKNELLGILQNGGDGEALVKLVSTNKMSQAEVLDNTLNFIANNQINSEALEFLKKGRFLDRGSKQEMTLEQYLGPDAMTRIEEAFLNRERQNYTNLRADAAAYGEGVYVQARAAAEADPNGKPKEYWEQFFDTWRNHPEFGSLPIPENWRELATTFSNENVQNNNLVKEWLAEIPLGTKTQADFDMLPPQVKARIQQVWDADPNGKAKFEGIARHRSGISKAVSNAAKLNGIESNSPSVQAKAEQLILNYEREIAGGKTANQAYKDILSDFQLAIDADKGKPLEDKKTLNNQEYLGVLNDAQQQSINRDATKLRKGKIERLLEQHKVDPVGSNIFEQQLFSVGLMKQWSLEIRSGNVSPHREEIDMAGALGITVIQLRQKFAEQNPNLGEEYSMEVPQPYAPILERITPAEERQMQKWGSLPYAQRVIAHHTGGRNYPVRNNNPEAIQEELQALLEVSAELGISAQDLATIISYESAGSFSPDQWGGHKGQHMGLIQFGPPERQTYGVTEGMSFADQLRGPVKQYFLDRFAKAGRSTQGATLLDLYRTVLGGNPKASIHVEDSFNTSPSIGVSEMGPHRESVRKRYGL